jgi:hypothetical protein
VPPNELEQSFFGMNFFGMDQDDNRIVGTGMIWIFVVASVMLTSITILFYYWLSRRDGVLFRRPAPRLGFSVESVATRLVQRLKVSGPNAGIELQNSGV